MPAVPSGQRWARCDPADVIVTLVEAGLVNPADVVGGALVAHDLSRSNQVLAVAPAGIVVKVGLPERLGDQGSADRERDLLRAFTDSGVAPGPELIWSDSSTVVVRRVEPGETVGDRRYRTGWRNEVFLFGRAVAECHAVGVDVVADVALPHRLPWALDSLTDSTPGFVSADPKMSALREQLCDDFELVSSLDAVRACWESTALIHGDIRWDNALVDGADPDERIVLVDWEFVDWGDRRWDVAGAYGEMLADVVRCGEAAADDAIGVLSASAAYIDRFSAGYRTVAGVAAPVDIRFVAARLVQTAFQHVAWLDDDVRVGWQLAALAAALVRTPGGRQ